MWDRAAARLREERRLRREAGHRETYAAVQPDYGPRPHQGFKRGPKPDPTRVCTDVVLTSRVTKREAKELQRHQRRLCRDASPSTFLRFVVCQWLEAHRDKSADPESFALDPDSLDWRTRRRGMAGSVP